MALIRDECAAGRHGKRLSMTTTEQAATDQTYVQTVCSSPVGELTVIGSESGVRAILWPHDRPGRVTINHVVTPDRDGRLDLVLDQLEEYFSGSRRKFTVPLVVSGTDFQRAVWRRLAEIPYGSTASYGEVATAIGRPSAARAVGAATGLNPISVIIPCHRLVGAKGALTGFAGGLDAKRWLLRHEQSQQRLL